MKTDPTRTLHWWGLAHLERTCGGSLCEAVFCDALADRGREPFREGTALLGTWASHNRDNTSMAQIETVQT